MTILLYLASSLHHYFPLNPKPRHGVLQMNVDRGHILANAAEGMECRS